MADHDYSSADFHNVVQKHVLNAVSETLGAGKLDWHLVAPFLAAAHEICRADFEQAAQIRLHTVRAEGDAWVDAEEAYLGIQVPDRDTGEPWLSQTWWISDIARADPDPAQVRRVVAALERSVAKLNAWLAEQTNEDPAQPE
jgi:hypothetical protein